MPPTETPRLTDRAALARQRDRARREGPADFLQRAAAEQVSERLAEVNRQFRDVAVIGPMAELWAGVLAEAAGIAAPRCLPDTEVLDLAPASLDLCIHALSLHWADDPVGQLVQMRRALRPDGLMIAALFGGQSLSELRAVLAESEVETSGGLSPRIAPMAEIRDLGALLQRAGFALPVADSTRLTVTYADALALMRDLRAMGEGNALAARNRRMPPRSLFARAAARYAAAFPADDDPSRIRATAEIVVLTGWAPDDSQQKPLRPGSARARLADALGTVEKPAGETAPATGGRGNRTD
ncbi:SAM-dependent methyltransferase [Halovulum dunhuangense]|uniref:SAM-dependent methyltransferase n=1 Tax=Halovulum dunhuangense TaxID=1505036 RepID=A0A849L055_9RHOB|nr:methyltransferase domain-containing protein [Halovulum dunhuangense]NNU79230.1 SAM-dependent methyltransferase [Halovulum dunhuangense]